jgi:hypothetical protein
MLHGEHDLQEKLVLFGGQGYDAPKDKRVGHCTTLDAKAPEPPEVYVTGDGGFGMGVPHPGEIHGAWTKP